MGKASLGPRGTLLFSLLTLSFALAGALPVRAQPEMADTRLGVRTVISGIGQAISMSFIGPNEFFLLQKGTGQVLRIKDGTNRGAVLDLGVNNFSERGLLGIALHPDFPDTPYVYLYWTCHTDAPPTNPFVPDVLECSNDNLLGTDSDDVLSVPLLANRIDRFRWSGGQLTFDKNLIKIRQFQNDAAPEPPNQGDGAQPARGNHDGGVLAFGPDGKLYAYVGDAGRRGQLQNLPSGPTPTGLGPVMADDQFGGPQPDNAHFSGVILRLNQDGSTPTDNPFYAAGAVMGGEVGANVQKIFAYGLRNSFGMAFDPESGNLWEQENGEDAFDELNLVEPGMNGGWIQFQGPASRIDEYKEIELTSTHGGGEDPPNLQQLRWLPGNIAATEAEARDRLFELPGSVYSDPEFSWKHVIAPAGIGFVDGDGLGKQFEGDLIVGLSVPQPEGGPLLRFHFTGNRRRFNLHDSRLRDLVADNPTFNDLTESEELVVGRNFGIVTDIRTGPNGNLFVVSLSNGAVYEVFRQDKKLTTGLASTATEPVDAAAVGVVTPGEGAGVIGFASQPQPNPTSGALSFRIALATAGPVTMRVVDTRGRLVAEPLNQTLGSGVHPVAWDGRTRDGVRAAAGIYYIHLSWPGFSDTRRVALMP